MLVLALTGCAPHLPASSPIDPTASARTSGTSLAVPGPAPHDRQIAASRASVAPLDLAVAAVRRFCRPDLSEAQWIADLDPLLTLEAASVYATVDPARVQCSKVALPAHTEEGDGFTQVVTVPTDRSPYRVVLSRSSLSDPWLVFRITPTRER